MIESYSSSFGKSYQNKISTLRSCDHFQIMKKSPTNQIQQTERSNISTDESVRQEVGTPRMNINLMQAISSPIKNGHLKLADNSIRRQSEFVSKKLYLPSVHFRTKYLSKLKSRKNLIGYYIKFDAENDSSSKSINSSYKYQKIEQHMNTSVQNDNLLLNTNKTKRVILSRLLHGKSPKKGCNTSITNQNIEAIHPQYGDPKIKVVNTYETDKKEIFESDHSETVEDRSKISSLPYKNVKLTTNTINKINIFKKNLITTIKKTPTRDLYDKIEFSFKKAEITNHRNVNSPNLPKVNPCLAKTNLAYYNNSSKTIASKTNSCQDSIIQTNQQRRKSILVNKNMVLLPNGKVRIIDKLESEIEFGRSDRMANDVLSQNL